jgi:hypothetical protein
MQASSSWAIVGADSLKIKEKNENNSKNERKIVRKTTVS